MRLLGVWIGTVFTFLFCSAVFADRVSFEPCAACHGASAEGNDALSAPQLAGQNAAYLVEQLINFRSGARGHNSADVMGQLMAGMAYGLTDTDINSLATYLSQIPSIPVAPSAGNKERGKLVYENHCLACHGPDAQGIEPLVTPNLRILSPSYIRAQLLGYERGWRGDANKGTTRAKGMRAIVIQLNGLEDVQDLMAYLHP